MKIARWLAKKIDIYFLIILVFIPRDIFIFILPLWNVIFTFQFFLLIEFHVKLLSIVSLDCFIICLIIISAVHINIWDAELERLAKQHADKLAELKTKLGR